MAYEITITIMHEITMKTEIKSIQLHDSIEGLSIILFIQWLGYSYKASDVFSKQDHLEKRVSFVYSLIMFKYIQTSFNKFIFDLNIAMYQMKSEAAPVNQSIK